VLGSFAPDVAKPAMTLVGDNSTVARWRNNRERQALALLLLIATAHAAAFALVYFVAVRTVRGRLVSDASLRGAISSRAAVQDTVEAVLNVVSIGSLLGALAVVVLIALVRLDRARGLVATSVLCVTNAATWILKEHVLTRPDLGLDEIAPATLNSLPSGHATAAVSAVAALVIVLPARWRLPTTLLGGGYATATALATMFAGWHRAVDCIAAFLLVGFCTVMASVILLALGRHRPEWPAAASYRWWLAAVIGSLTLGVLLSILSAINPVLTTLVGSLFAFLSSGLLIVGTLLGVLGGMLWVLQVTDGTRSGPNRGETRTRPDA
jgi:membrane-associated phospholipid phosphatase